MNGLSDPKPEMSERDKLKEEMKAVTSKGKTNENVRSLVISKLLTDSAPHNA